MKLLQHLDELSTGVVDISACLAAVIIIIVMIIIISIMTSCDHEVIMSCHHLIDVVNRPTDTSYRRMIPASAVVDMTGMTHPAVM